MKKMLRNIIVKSGLWIFMFMAILLVSCSDEKLPENSDQKHSRLTIRISTGEQTRGEHYFEPESVMSREQTVEELTVLLYFNPDGLNGNSNTPIYFAKHFTKEEFQQSGKDIVVSIDADENEIHEGDRIVVLANMGNQTSCKTLGDVQQLIPGETYSVSSDGVSPGDYSRFAMSNENNVDGKITFVKVSNDLRKDFSANVAIQRLAARIDYDMEGSEEIFNDYVLYQAVDIKGNETAYVYVSHIAPVNVMRKPTYALQRTTTGLSEDKSCFQSWNYCMPLLCDMGKKPLSYVMEPNTEAKASLSMLEDWYGDTRGEKILEMSHDYFDKSKNPGIRTIIEVIEDASAKAATYSDDIRILAYANENTQHLSDLRAECLTGLVIRAIYSPRYIFTDEYLTRWDGYPGESYPDIDPATGHTIDYWRYMPTIKTTSEADVIYFKDEETALAYSRLHPDDYAEIKKFPGGVCYYNVWLKNVVIENRKDPTPSTFPMEYGIVRNHVYRISLSFRGIGREGIRIEEPDNAVLTVTVRPWRKFGHDEIIM